MLRMCRPRMSCSCIYDRGCYPVDTRGYRQTLVAVEWIACTGDSMMLSPRSVSFPTWRRRRSANLGIGTGPAGDLGYRAQELYHQSSTSQISADWLSIAFVGPLRGNSRSSARNGWIVARVGIASKLVLA